MNWISVKDKLPDCFEQHNLVYSSGKVIVYGWEGVDVDEYLNYYNDQGQLLKEGWSSGLDITHWCIPVPPI